MALGFELLTRALSLKLSFKLLRPFVLVSSSGALVYAQGFMAQAGVPVSQSEFILHFFARRQNFALPLDGRIRN